MTAWDRTAERAYVAALQPWGGATIQLETGRLVPDGVTAFAVADRSAGDTIRIDAGAGFDTFADAFALARAEFDGAPFVGVFHDAAHDEIQFDPVRVVRTAREVDALFTQSPTTGGAYDFATGNGYWPAYALAS